MPVEACSPRIDPRRHETGSPGTPMFPVSAYQTPVGDSVPESIPWHWHEAAEVIFVSQGELRLGVPDHSYLLSEGDAVFINSSVLHTAAHSGGGPAEIQSLVFDPRLIFGAVESAIEQKYVRPVLASPGLAAIRLRGNTQWQSDAAGCIREAFRRYQEETFGYELFVREALSRLWLLIASNMRGEPGQKQGKSDADAARVKDMIRYIDAHYAEAITLCGIAQSGLVSERECLRSFRRILGTTPMQYLLSHRIAAAAGLLADSDRSVTEVGRLSGFDSPSYFSKRFRELTGFSPKEYRMSARE